MTDEKLKRCKSKGCKNPAYDGKYCDYCRQKGKEKKIKIAGTLTAAIIAVVTTIKKVPKIGEKVIKAIARK